MLPTAMDHSSCLPTCCKHMWLLH